VEKEEVDVLAAPRGILIQSAIATGTDFLPRFNSVLNRVEYVSAMIGTLGDMRRQAEKISCRGLKSLDKF
jgi:hypothetical protein